MSFARDPSLSQKPECSVRSWVDVTALSGYHPSASASIEESCEAHRSTILARRYISKEQKNLYPTELGEVVKGGEVVKVVKWTFAWNKRTAPAGVYPEGTDVPFTANGDGSWSWVTQYDAITANLGVAYGATHYWEMIEAQTEQDFFVIVRYPKSTYNFITGDVPNYQNLARADLEVTDPQNEGDVRPDPENGITGNDFNDTDSGTANAYAEYIPYGGWGWGGGEYSVSKTSINNVFGSGAGPGWIYYGASPRGEFTVVMNGEGYNLTNLGRGYSMTVWDDDFYVRSVYTTEAGTTAYGPWTKCGPGDYYITMGGSTTNSRIRITAWRGDRTTGVHIMDASMLPEGSFKLY